MTYTILPDAVPLASVMQMLEELDPYTGPPLVEDAPEGELQVRLLWPYELGRDSFVDALVAMEVWRQRHKDFVLNVLDQIGEGMILVSDTLEPKHVSASAFSAVSLDHFAHGCFEVSDPRLRDLERYDRAEICISKAAEAAIRKLVAQKNQGGRPEHPAKAWYASQGFDRQGRSIKELQREMEKAVGKAPSEKTIRSWEKEFSE